MVRERRIQNCAKIMMILVLFFLHSLLFSTTPPEQDQETKGIQLVSWLKERAQPLPQTEHCHIEELKVVLEKGGTRERVATIFSKFFGEELTNRALSMGFPEKLDRKLTIKFLASIGSQIRLDDLENAFQELRNGNKRRLILHFSPISKLELWTTKSICDLSPESFEHFLDLFRNPLQIVDNKCQKSLGDLIEENGLSDVEALLLTYHDDLTRKLAKAKSKTRPELTLAPQELLSRNIAYLSPTHLQKGMVMRSYDFDSKQTFIYVLKESIQYKGIYGYLFEPVYSGKHPIQLIFRGTYCKESAYRNFDPKGFGKKIFDEKAKELKSKLSSVNGNRLVISGHSLGALDAQRAAVLLTTPKSPLNYQSLKVFAFCSPNLDNPALKKWEENLNHLAQRENKPYIELNFAYHEKDIITLSEYETLSSSPNFYIQRNYLVVKSDSGIWNTKQHHMTPFFKNGQFDASVDHRTFSFYQSVSEQKIIEYKNRLKAARNSLPLLRNLKSYFVDVDHPEEIKRHLKKMQDQREQLEDYLEEKKASWLLWTAQNTINYTLPIRSIISPIFRWFAGIIEEQKDESSVMAFESD